jgi:hypothetical protein
VRWRLGISSSLYVYAGDDGASEMDLDGEEVKRKDVGEAGRTVVGGGASHGAGWQSVLIRAPSPHPMSRTCVPVSDHGEWTRTRRHYA